MLQRRVIYTGFVFIVMETEALSLCSSEYLGIWSSVSNNAGNCISLTMRHFFFPTRKDGEFSMFITCPYDCKIGVHLLGRGTCVINLN